MPYRGCAVRACPGDWASQEGARGPWAGLAFQKPLLGEGLPEPSLPPSPHSVGTEVCPGQAPVAQEGADACRGGV